MQYINTKTPGSNKSVQQITDLELNQTTSILDEDTQIENLIAIR